MLPSLFVLSFWFLFRFCNFSQTGYHQQEDLAKFGYRPEMKVLKKKSLESFYTFAMFLLETTAEIWLLIFLNLFWKPVELGPYYPFYTKIRCRNRNHIFQVKKFKNIAPSIPPKTKKNYLFQNVCPQNPYRKQHVLSLTKSVYETKET